MKVFVAVDIGCIECGESSAVLFVGEDKQQAIAIAQEHERRQAKDWHGEHSFTIHEVELGSEQRQEYKL